MKRVVISIILILGIMALAIGSLIYITSSTTEIIGKVELVHKSYNDGERERVILLAGETEELWKAFSKNRFFLAENEYAMEIGMIVSRVAAMAKENNDELGVECHSLISMLKEFQEKQVPNYKNVF